MDAGPNIWSVVCSGPLHGLLMEETTCRCAGLLQMYWLNSHGQSTGVVLQFMGLFTGHKLLIVRQL